LARWIHDLQEQEKPNDSQQKIINEMRERLRAYDLLEKEGILLDELANWDGLQVPMEDWRCGDVMEPLNGGVKV
jgi:hypothetical protein